MLRYEDLVAGTLLRLYSSVGLVPIKARQLTFESTSSATDVG